VVQRRRLPIVLLVLLVATAILVPAGSPSRGQEGGIFRISFAPQAGLDHIDPALSFSQPGWTLLDAVCARLMTHPDKSAPKAFEVVPEVAAAPPKATDDFRTFTFTLRAGFRFSDGTPLRASAFAHAINRTLAPGVNSPGALFTRDIVGAADVLAGRTKRASGVVARGNTLVIRLTRPAPGFAARTTLPFFCAVPPGLPPNPEGVGAFDSAGPFYVAEYRPGERVVIVRNRHYGGSRPVRVDGFEVDLRAPSPTEMIRRIEARISSMDGSCWVFVSATRRCSSKGGPPGLAAARRSPINYHERGLMNRDPAPFPRGAELTPHPFRCR